MSESARVIVGVDGSHHSPGVVQRAVYEARKRDALILPVIAWTASDDDGLRPFSELAYAARRRLDATFELAFDGFPEDVRIHPLVLRAEPGPALVSTADRRDDLLVVGGGRHAMRPRSAHGPVTGYCWANAVCEVLIVPPFTLPERPERPERPEPGGVGAHCHAGIGYLD